MSTFEVKVVKLDSVEKHPNADSLDVATIGGYRAIVKLGEYKAGDLAIYIPEAALVPIPLLEKIGLAGKLAGSERNRVKAIKLRSLLSQGLVIPTSFASDAKEGDNVAEHLGIVKWEPPVPTHMSGELIGLSNYTIPYDIENLKKFWNVITDGEEVIFTEKLHGTFCCLVYHPETNIDDRLFVKPNGTFFAYSKGLGAKGLVFKNSPTNDNNLYVKTLVGSKFYDMKFDHPLYVFGEVFGRGVQDLTYGVDHSFRVFDIWKGDRSGGFLDYDQMVATATQIGFETVPFLYRGPFSHEVADEHSSGVTSFGGFNIREGIVIKPTTERLDNELGRVILKHISPDYLTRKDATEFT